MQIVKVHMAANKFPISFLHGLLLIRNKEDYTRISFNILEVILYLWISYFILGSYFLWLFGNFSIFLSHPLIALGPSKFKLFFGVNNFTYDLHRVIAVFIGSIFINLGRRGWNSFYGICIALGFYTIYILIIISSPLMQEYQNLAAKLIAGGTYSIRVLISAFIFLLCVLAGWLGSKIGGKISDKSLLISIGTILCLVAIGSLIYKNHAYLFWPLILSGTFTISKSTEWFRSKRLTLKLETVLR